MKEIHVGFLGCGNIGCGVWNLLRDAEERFEQTHGVRFAVRKILVRDVKKERAAQIPREVLTTEAGEVLHDPDIGLVVEFMGGEEPAAHYMMEALRQGKSVVTANKMALSLHWEELMREAKNHHAAIYYEASVCGAIPIISTLNDSLQANRIERMYGIVNGTTNYILSSMSQSGVSYADALKEAQRLGFAEPDPTSDVEGYDAAYKLSILASLAFRCHIPVGSVYREGITRVEASDIAFGQEMGYTLKLLALAKQSAEGIQVRVHPTFIPRLHPLASVSGSFNSVFLSGDACDDMMLYGRGAGSAPTSSAVVSDMLAAARFDSPVYPAVDADRANTAILDNWESAFYIRLSAADRPGVLAHVAACLGERGVSIRYMVQRSETPSARVPIVLITHKAMEKDVRAALDAIAPENALVDNVIRVEE